MSHSHYPHSKIEPKNAAQLMKFITRLPVEFQIVTLSNAVKAKPAIVQVPEIQDWVMKYAADAGEGML